MHSTSHMGCTMPHELYSVAVVKRDALPHGGIHPQGHGHSATVCAVVLRRT